MNKITVKDKYYNYVSVREIVKELDSTLNEPELRILTSKVYEHYGINLKTVDYLSSTFSLLQDKEVDEFDKIISILLLQK